jgi:hypothetical protein
MNDSAVDYVVQEGMLATRNIRICTMKSAAGCRSQLAAGLHEAFDPSQKAKRKRQRSEGSQAVSGQRRRARR